MSVTEILSKVNSWFDHEYGWVIYAFLVVVLTLTVVFFLRKMLTILEEKSKLTKTPWDDGIIEALQLPLRSYVWLLGIAFAADIVAHNIGPSISDFTEKLRELSFIIALAWFLIRLVKKIERNFIDPQYHTESVDETTAKAIGKLIRASIFITSSLIIMQNLGYSISGILAFGGIGGIAIGFAAKDLLANFFGGLTIYLDKPFKVGDWIRSADRQIEGTVEDIGWRLTRIRTFDKRPLFIPNATFTQIGIENPSRMLNRRIKETIGIRYDDASKMSIIIDQVKNMLQTHPEIDATQTLIVNFNSFAPSSLDFFIYTFTKTTDWVKFHSVKQDVLLKVIEIIEANGAECAFPTSTLHIASAPNIENLNQ